MYYWFSYQNKYFKKNLQKVSSNFPKWRWRRKWQGSGARLCGNWTNYSNNSWGNDHTVIAIIIGFVVTGPHRF